MRPVAFLLLGVLMMNGDAQGRRPQAVPHYRLEATSAASLRDLTEDQPTCHPSVTVVLKQGAGQP